MRKQCLIAALLVSTMLIVSVSFVHAHKRNGGQVQAIPVTIRIQQCVDSSVRGPLFFLISGAKGVYRENEPAHYAIETNIPVRVQFTASPVRYVSTLDSLQKRTGHTLEAVFWVNSQEHTFSDQQPLIMQLDHAQLFEGEIFGQVFIHAVEAQPAGVYEGMITITVSPALEE